MSQTLGEVVVKVGLDANKIKSDMKDIENNVTSGGQKMESKLTSSFKNIGIAIVQMFAIQKISQFFSEATKQAAAFEEAMSFFKGSAQDMDNLRKSVKGTVSDFNLVKLSNQAADLGVEIKQQPLLFALAEKAADAYGTSIEEGFQKVIMATEGSAKGLKAIGIQKKVYED